MRTEIGGLGGSHGRKYMGFSTKEEAFSNHQNGTNTQQASSGGKSSSPWECSGTFHSAEHQSVTFEEAVPILGARVNQKTEDAFNSKIPRTPVVQL